jgi:hypothetical protein
MSGPLLLCHSSLPWWINLAGEKQLYLVHFSQLLARFFKVCRTFPYYVYNEITDSSVIEASSKHIPQFVIARFFIGWGLSYTVVASPLLLVELALPKHRGAIIAYFPTVWYLGAIIAAWTTFGTRQINNSWSWRIPSLLQGIPALLQIFGIFFVPESPRWLISKGRGVEAKAILTKHHANGREGDPLVELEYSEIKEAIVKDHGYTEKSTWADLFKTAPNRRRMILVFFCGLFLEISGNG